MRRKMKQKLYPLSLNLSKKYLEVETNSQKKFEDHYVITPSINFSNADIDRTSNNVGEKGHFVKQGFEYNSGSNPHFLNTKEILEYNKAMNL